VSWDCLPKRVGPMDDEPQQFTLIQQFPGDYELGSERSVYWREPLIGSLAAFLRRSRGDWKIASWGGCHIGRMCIYSVALN
jgi:hypothetical protein